jgi:hypothetical protein
MFHLKLPSMRFFIVFFQVLFMYCAVCLAGSPFLAIAETSSPVIDWLMNHSAIVLVVISLAMAFLPTSYAAVAKSIFTVISAIFSSKNTAVADSTTKKK